MDGGAPSSRSILVLHVKLKSVESALPSAAVLCCVLQDPHFKVANHRRRIIQPCLLTEYAHIMAPGGWLYTITDVPELGEWMVRV